MNTDLQQSDRARLDEAHHLRYRGEANQLRAALFTAYVVGLFGIVYGILASHYVFQTWPQIRDRVNDAPLLYAAGSVALVALVALLAYRAGRRRGPVVPEPGHLEFVTATDLPRHLTLQDAWRATCVVVASGMLGVGIAVPGGLAISGGSSLAVLFGVVLALLGAPTVLYAWLRGEAAGHAHSAKVGQLLNSLPMNVLRTQSLMSDSISSALVAGDTRRARAQAFELKLGHRPLRIRAAGPWRTTIGADFAGLQRLGWVSLGWLIVQIAAVTLASIEPVVRSRSPLVLPIVVVLAHLTTSGLTRGLQHHSETAGEPSILGIPWQVETLLHLLPVAVLQLVVAFAAASLSGVAPSLAIVHAVSIALLLSAGQLFFVHKGPPPLALMGNGAGRGIGLLWVAHPTILVALVGLVGVLGSSELLIGALLLLSFGWTRTSSKFSPAQPR
ncbi:MAG: hypothetical protein ABI384_02205 [Allobranchiibius sp.]